jgi:hypothetical protein
MQLSHLCPVPVDARLISGMHGIGTEVMEDSTEFSMLFCKKTTKAVQGEGRNRTMSLTATSLNTLIYKAILTLILKGLKRFLALHATYRP